MGIRKDYTQSSMQMGQCLQSALRDTNTNRSELAEALECSTDTVDNWCSGRTHISTGLIVKLCFFLKFKGLSDSKVNCIYQLFLKSYGLSNSWPPNEQNHSEITLIALGSIAYRKELAMLEQTSTFLSEANHKTLIFQCGNDTQALLSCVDLSNQIGASSLILCGFSLPSDIYELILSQAHGYKRFVFLILTNCNKDVVYKYPNVYVISWSNYLLAYKATTFLIDQGHKHIGTVHLVRYPDRYRGYLAALQERGITPQPELIFEIGNLVGYDVLSPAVMKRLEKHLKTKAMTAIYTPTELLTLVVPITTMKNKIGFDKDLFIMGMAYPGWIVESIGLPISYICYPIEDLTRTLIHLLLHRVTSNNDPPEDRYIDITAKAKIIHHEAGHRRIPLLGQDRGSIKVGSRYP